MADAIAGIIPNIRGRVVSANFDLRRLHHRGTEAREWALSAAPLLWPIGSQGCRVAACRATTSPGYCRVLDAAAQQRPDAPASTIEPDDAGIIPTWCPRCDVLVHRTL